MPSLLDLSAEELIAKGIAPIKKEHLLPYITRPPVAAKVDKDSVLEAAGTIAGGSGSADVTAGTGATANGDAAAAQAQADDKVVAQKSKRQIRKEFREKKTKTAGLCNNFLHGRCQYGDKCKYRHDASAFLADKQPDLPGRCPFSLLDACPHGMTCRWASSHNKQQQRPADAATAPSDPATANGNAELQTQTASEPASATAGAAAGTTATLNGTATAPASDAAATTSGSAAVDKNIAAEAADLQPVANLPLITDIQQPLNSLAKDVQRQLWKGSYDFSKSDAVLASLGLYNAASRKQQQQQRGGQQQGRNGKQQQKRGQHAGAEQQAGKKQRVDAAAAAGEAAALPPAPASAAESDMVVDDLNAAVGNVLAAAAVDESVPAAAIAVEALEQAAAAPVADAAAAAATAPAEQAGVPAAAAEVVEDVLDSLYDTAEQQTGLVATAAPVAAPTSAPAAAEAAAVDSLDSLYDAAEQSPAAAAPPAPAAAAPALAIGSDASLIAKLQAWRQQQQQMLGSCTEPSREPRAAPKLDIAGKTYLAPLTTVGNLPFRRLCVGLGCDITCGEMALATNLLQGQNSEWALLKRHPSEKMFGIQVCGGYPDTMAQLAQVVNEQVNCDFVDINCGCPIDIICNRGAGSALLTRPLQLERVVRATTGCLDKPVIVKIRKGYYDDKDIAHTLIPQMKSWGAAACTLHGRSRQQRYSRAADWEYIKRCAGIAKRSGLPLIGNGDVFSPTEWSTRLETGVATAMIGRAALVKPWIFTEIKEQRLWDISSSKRLDMLKTYVSHGLEHWGSDSRGVENTRRFMLEWLSFTHRYIPVGLLEVLPQKMSWRPPAYVARNQLEALMASESAADWVKISEMLLGPAPPGFTFAPKHKSNAYSVSADALQQLAAATAAGQQHLQELAAEEQENG